MTLAEFQVILHRLYQGDTSDPSSSDEDYDVRTAYLEAAISAWNGEKGVMWRELWIEATGTTLLGSSISLATFTDFRFPGGFVRIKIDGTNWTFIPIVDQPKSELFKNQSTAQSSQVAWITGNKKTGFTINLSFSIAAGLAWEMPYYKDPFLPTVPANVIEMSDPYFAVYFCLSKLHEVDGEGDRATLALTMADSRLSAMRFLNSRMPSYQENAAPDRDNELGVGGFGE